jgi:FixJ family two-component response regulator
MIIDRYARGSGQVILVLDDDAVVCAMLKRLLSEEGYEVICCANPETLIALCRETTPACVLLDLLLPGTSGLNILKDLRQFHVTAPILVISGQADIGSAVRAMKEGAADFIEKPFQGPDLLSRVRAAIGALARRKRQDTELVLDSLTTREQQILERLAAGLTNKQVAQALHLSSRTIESYRAKIMKKLGAKNAADLIRIALTAKGRPPCEQAT